MTGAGRTGRAVCVLGMHRSGTSLVAQVLEGLGVSFGPRERLIPPDEATNAEGFYEDAEIVRVNDRILETFGGTWSRPPRLPSGWPQHPELADVRIWAQRAVAASRGGAELWGWKDPRSCLTVELWRELVAIEAYVICVRDPREVAASLYSRDGIPYEVACALWQRYMRHAVLETDGRPRIAVDYAALVEQPEAQAQRLAEFLQIPISARTVARGAGRVRRELRSHEAIGMGPDLAWSPTVRHTYAALRLAADAEGLGELSHRMLTELCRVELPDGMSDAGADHNFTKTKP